MNCPRCKGSLIKSGSGVQCLSCSRTFGIMGVEEEVTELTEREKYRNLLEFIHDSTTAEGQRERRKH